MTESPKMAILRMAILAEIDDLARAIRGGIKPLGVASRLTSLAAVVEESVAADHSARDRKGTV